MIDNVIQVLGLLAVVIALYFASAQARGLRKQVHIANLFSRYEALSHASERYDTGLALIFQRPDLRPYVFERKRLDLQGDDLARALTVADIMAGATDYAVRVGERFPDGLRTDWHAVAAEMARQPLFQAIVHEQPHQFPGLAQYFFANGTPATDRRKAERDTTPVRDGA